MAERYDLPREATAVAKQRYETVQSTKWQALSWQLASLPLAEGEPMHVVQF